MKRVGVTGAAGFIGSHLCERLLAEDIEVVAIDDLSYGSIANVAPFLDHPRLPVRGARLHEPARAAHRVRRLRRDRPSRGEEDPALRRGRSSTLEINVGGVNAAAAVAMALDADLVFTSTSDVYGDGTPPYNEEGEIVLGPPTSKRWSYAVSKLYDEHHLLALADERGLRTTILRLFNAYGPRNHLSWWGGPMVTFVEALLDGEQMEIHGDGQQTRTFTYVSDTVDGIVRALRTPESRGEIVNVGGTQTTTILDLAARIQRAMHIPQPLRANFVGYETLPGKYQDVRHRIPDTTKAQELLGFEAQIGIDEGLDRTIAWHRAQRAGSAAARA